jgi:hypothetical protein
MVRYSREGALSAWGCVIRVDVDSAFVVKDICIQHEEDYDRHDSMMNETSSENAEYHRIRTTGRK